MTSHEFSSVAPPPRRTLASVERLEDRDLPASVFPTTVLNLGDSYSRFTGDLRSIELHSEATPAEFQALRDDARAISAATASTSLAPQAADNLATAVTLQLDRAALDGWLSPSGWGSVESRLVPNLQGLGAPPSLIAQTESDMQAVATSARVTMDEYNTFTHDFNALRADESQPGAGSYHYPDPQLYFSQNLLGFFRGAAVGRSADRAQLAADLNSLTSGAGSRPSDAAAVRRDAQFLQKLGAAVPSTSFSQVLATFQAAFAQGPPTSASLASLQSDLVSELGTAATPARTSLVGRLVSDAPAFYQGLGSSPGNVQTIATDLQAVVNDGVGSTPDPFRVTVVPPQGR